MSEPVTNGPSGSFTLNDLIAHICAPQLSKHLQEMHDFICDVKVLALTLDGEGRSQDILGRTAIAWTVKNRQLGRGPLSDKDRSIAEICLRRLQYSTWFELGGKENYERQMRLAEAVIKGLPLVDFGFTIGQWKKYQESEYIAAGVIKGLLLDPTGGACHYLTKVFYASAKAPRWVSQATGAREIGDHIFLSGIR